MIKWFGHVVCDRGFLINLKHREDRFNSSQIELIKANIEGVERFDAVKIEGLYHKYGCSQSHLDIAKKQVENQWSYVLYLEDDIKCDFFYNDFLKDKKIDIEQIVNHLVIDLKEIKPDVLWLGVRPEDYCEKITNIFVKPKKTLMSHAYIGSLNYANFLLEHYRYYDSNHFTHNWPIDFFISQINTKDDWKLNLHNNSSFILNNLKIVVTLPLIFNQKASNSDLLDRFVDYEIWVRGCYNEYANCDKLNMKPYIYE